MQYFLGKIRLSNTIIVVLGALSFFVGSVEAKKSLRKHKPILLKDRVDWRSQDGRFQLRKIRTNLWVEYRNGVLTKHVFHAYIETGRYTALYDLKRHINLRIFPRFSFIRRDALSKTSRWKRFRRGSWAKKTNKRLKKPTSQATSRPTSQANRLNPEALLPAFSKHIGWLSHSKRTRFQRVSGSLWRRFRGRDLTNFFFLAFKQTPQSIEFFEPQYKIWIKLTKDAAFLKTRAVSRAYKMLGKGHWTQKRVLGKYAWISQTGSFRWQKVRGHIWSRIIKSRAFGSLLQELEQNKTYTEIGNHSVQIRLYDSFAFVRFQRGKKGSWNQWKRLAKGGWTTNPAPARVNKKALHSFLRGLKRQQTKKKHSSKTKKIVAQKKQKLRIKKLRKKAAKKKKNIRKHKKKSRGQKRQKKKRKKRKEMRVRVKKVKMYPYSTVSFLRIVRANHKKRYGTGVMIGARLLLTSAHLLYDRKQRKHVRTINIYPALMHKKMPFGASSAVRWMVHPRWVSAKTLKEAKLHDLAVVLLKKPLGRKTGWLTPYANRSRRTKHALLMVLGYPLSLFFRTHKLWQWKETSRGEVQTKKSFPLRWKILTKHRVGFSGGEPLLMKMGRFWRIVGVVRSRVGRLAESVRISTQHLRWILYAKRRVLRRKSSRRKNPFGDVSSLPKTPSKLFFWEGQGLDLDALEE